MWSPHPDSLLLAIRWCYAWELGIRSTTCYIGDNIWSAQVRRIRLAVEVRRYDFGGGDELARVALGVVGTVD